MKKRISMPSATREQVFRKDPSNQSWRRDSRLRRVAAWLPERHVVVFVPGRGLHGELSQAPTQLARPNVPRGNVFACLFTHTPNPKPTRTNKNNTEELVMK